MKNALLITISLLSMSILGQKNTSTINEKSKISNLKNVTNNLKIYCNGGVVSTITKNNLIFHKKYSVKIIDLGCVHPSGKDLENYKKLNVKTFESLKIKFGLKWISELEQDAIGLSEWKMR